MGYCAISAGRARHSPGRSERSALPLQSRAHPLLVEALGGNAVTDLVGSSRRFLRSAVTVAASMGMSSDSIDEVVSSALQDVRTHAHAKKDCGG
jgi:hypothetical protein